MSFTQLNPKTWRDVSENKKLKEALEFYFDEKNWFNINRNARDVIDNDDLEFVRNERNVYFDGSIGGKLARRTLRELNND